MRFLSLALDGVRFRSPGTVTSGLTVPSLLGIHNRMNNLNLNHESLCPVPILPSGPGLQGL